MEWQLWRQAGVGALRYYKR